MSATRGVGGSAVSEIAYRSSAAATQLARRPTAVHQTLGRTEAGCRESRTIKDLRTEKFVPEIAYKLVTAVDSREKKQHRQEREITETFQIHKKKDR